jgi:hypothetical protein
MDSVPQVPPIEISVKSLPEYVRGLPAYLAVTITAPPGTAFSGLRFANLLDLGGATGIELKSAEGKIVVHEVPVPQRFENPEDLGGILHDGESRRMLTDVSPGLPASLPEGQYHARIVYAANRRKQFWSKSFEIKFRDPTKTEADWITSLAPDRSKALAWTDWTYTRPKQPVFTGEINPETRSFMNPRCGRSRRSCIRLITTNKNIRTVSRGSIRVPRACNGGFACWKVVEVFSAHSGSAPSVDAWG